MSDGIIRELDNVRHIPEPKRNLISLSMLDKAGCCIRLESSSLKVIKGSLILMKGVMQHGLYILKGTAITGDAGVVIKQDQDKTLLWHFRLGHVSESGLKELEKQGALGSDKISTVGFCEECVLGKSSRTRFKTAVHNTKGTLDYIHSDLWGPAQIESLGAETPHFEVELSKTEDGKNTSHTGETQGSDETNAQSQEHISIQDYQFTRDRQKRQVRAPERLGYADLIAYALTAAHEVDQEEPKTYEESVACKESAQWIKAMEDEMDSLYKNGTWKLIQKLEGKKVVGCKWVYKVKDEIPDVEPKRFKARLVAKGFTQREGVDYTEVFSHVVRHTSIRIILSLVAVYDIHLEQLDVKTAFLHGDLQEEIVMSQLEGFVNAQHPDWKSSYDCCVYLRKTYGEEVIYLVLYVDDMLLASKSMKLIDLPKQQLKDKFDMKDLSPAKKILGVEMIRNRTARTLFLSQEKYVNKVLEKFAMLNCKPVSTPMAAHFSKPGQQVYVKSREGTLEGCEMDTEVSKRDYKLCWKASLQSVVALSTTEAEYTAVAEAFKEAIWLRGMINELGYEQSSIAILCDSQSAISLSKNQVHHEKTKHIDIKLHFIRLEISKGTVKLVKVHTSNNVADMLTKPVPMAKFEHCLNLAGICRI
ncbi:reverse transcriptase Ty1/copia-type domain-containing protein [Citrus sinensis]|nr:reverse transcriptase Ty1/copia-type domain-containing protein [Citrus sinensis]